MNQFGYKKTMKDIYILARKTEREKRGKRRKKIH